MSHAMKHGIWALVALLGASALAVVATSRGETISALWIIAAAASTYLIGYRYYSLYIAKRVMQLDPERTTPAVRHNDGLDYVPTNRYVRFGISNQMLAAVAPMLGTVVVFKMKRQRYAWGTIVPAAWLIVCTLAAGLMKLFLPDPAIGLLAHAGRLSAALDRGEILAPEKWLAAFNQTIWNDRIDAALCALFVLVVASILVFAVRACSRVYGVPRWSAVEVPPQPVAAE